jgi:hypothetical protein
MDIACGDVRSIRTLVDERFRHVLAFLGMPDEPERNGDTLAGQEALVLLVGDLPDLPKKGWRQVRAAEDLNGDVAGDDAQLLRVDLGEYLVDERELGRRWRECFGRHDEHERRRRKGRRTRAERNVEPLMTALSALRVRRVNRPEIRSSIGSALAFKHLCLLSCQVKLIIYFLSPLQHDAPTRHAARPALEPRHNTFRLRPPLPSSLGSV